MLFNEKRDQDSKDALKIAFDKVKNDIFFVGSEVSTMKNDIFELKSQLNHINESLNSLKIDILNINSKQDDPIFPTNIPTHYPEKPAIPNIPADSPTVPVEIGGLKYPNFDTSIRNEGVPTDRQTNQQTDIYTRFSDVESESAAYFDSLKKASYPPLKQAENSISKPLSQQIKDASDILDSLDNIKKEIRLKFKNMTNQEMLVFSTIYQLEEAFPEGVEYRQIASKLRLSESSIRDYVQKLITKGIPVDKLKMNNKKILLKISSELKNIAPLETIIKLREL